MINRPIPAPGSPAARGFSPDLLAEADCLRQLALAQPERLLPVAVPVPPPLVDPPL
jgi:hypothetical protein